MIANLSQAVDALAKATQNLAQHLAARPVDWSSYVLAAATIVLVMVTAYYARQTFRLVQENRRTADETRKAAEAAVASAKAAEEMVRIERERLWDADRPDLSVHLQQIAPISTTQLVKADVVVTNCGPGPAENMVMSGAVSADGDWMDLAPDRQMASSLGPGGRDRVAFMGPPATAELLHHFVFICHYTDTHSTPGNKRVYHSCFDGKPNPVCQTYRPGRELPDLYRRLCRQCRDSAASR